MNNIIKFANKNIFPLSIIFIMVISRLIPHPPNFTPIIAVAMMSGYFFKNLNLSILVLLIAMLVSDLFIGFHGNMLFVYLPLLLTVFFFFLITKKINYKNLFIFGFASSLIFFLISNLGVWMLGSLYEKNLSGLINCYVLAIPFFKNTVLSTLLFSYSAFAANYFFLKKSSY